MKKIIFTLFVMLLTVQLFAQGQDATLTESVYASGKIYVVVACAALILFGLLFFLFSIDKRLKKLEKKSANKN